MSEKASSAKGRLRIEVAVVPNLDKDAFNSAVDNIKLNPKKIEIQADTSLLKKNIKDSVNAAIKEINSNKNGFKDIKVELDFGFDTQAEAFARELQSKINSTLQSFIKQKKYTGKTTKKQTASSDDDKSKYISKSAKTITRSPSKQSEPDKSSSDSSASKKPKAGKISDPIVSGIDLEDVSRKISGVSASVKTLSEALDKVKQAFSDTSDAAGIYKNALDDISNVSVPKIEDTLQQLTQNVQVQPAQAPTKNSQNTSSQSQPQSETPRKKYRIKQTSSAPNKENLQPAYNAIKRNFEDVKVKSNYADASLYVDRSKLSKAETASLDSIEKKITDELSRLYGDRAAITSEALSKLKADVTDYKNLVTRLNEYQRSKAFNSSYNSVVKPTKNLMQEASDFRIDTSDLEDKLSELKRVKESIVSEDGRIIDSSDSANRAFNKQAASVRDASNAIKEQIRLKKEAFRNTDNKFNSVVNGQNDDSSKLFIDPKKTTEDEKKQINDIKSNIESELNSMRTSGANITEDSINAVNGYITKLTKLLKDIHKKQFGGFKNAERVDSTYSSAKRSADRAIASATKYGIDTSALTGQGGALEKLLQEKENVVDADGKLIDTSLASKEAFLSAARAVREETEALQEQIRIKKENASIKKSKNVDSIETKYFDAKALSEREGTSLYLDRSKITDEERKSLDDLESSITSTINDMRSGQKAITDQSLADLRSYINKYKKLLSDLRNEQIGGFRSSDQINNKFENSLSATKNAIREASDLGIDTSKLDDEIAELTRIKTGIVSADGKIVDSSESARKAFENQAKSVKDATEALQEQIRIKKEFNSIESKAKDAYDQLFRARENYSGTGYQKTPELDKIFASGGQLDRLFNLKTSAIQGLEPTKKDLEDIISLWGIVSSMMKDSSAFSRVSGQITQLDTNMKNLVSQINRYLDANSKVKSNATLARSFETLKDNIKSGVIAGKEATNSFANLRQQAIELGLESEDIVNKVIKLFKDHINTGLVMGSLNLIRDGFRQVIMEVRNVDTAMTELKKVTNATSAEYERFLSNAADRARTLGTSLSDVISMTADFARLGYSMSDASSLSDAASIYYNVGDGLQDASEASESLISIMKAYKIEAKDALSIVDRLNEVSNTEPISSGGLGTGLALSASALAEANNTLDESLALITAANSVVQNPEVVGTALKTVSMRIRGMKVELEELGEDTTGVVETTSELQGKLLALTNGTVDIMEADGVTIKSTFDILKELAAVYGDLTDTNQAAILELLSGKRNGNIVASILQNADMLDRVAETARNSSGSATKENERYLDSINGKLEQLTATFQQLSTNILDSELVKGVVDTGSGILGLLNSITESLGAIPAIAATAAAALSGIKNIG